MPYYRRPYKRARYGKKLKYSVQQKCITVTTPDESNTGKVEVVPGTDVEGMRKVKHLTVSMSPTQQIPSASTGLSCMFLRGLLQGTSTSQGHCQHRCMSLTSL